ncbi:MAG TPA: hypothetical protein VK166_15080 [Chitinophagaceae bacterium]|nr:hypothetical protein [Chitinophagaceae bacterium]
MLLKTFIAVALLTSVFHHAGSSDLSSVYIASTPGDDPIKMILSIPAESKVDFMRWNLVLSSSGEFSLKLSYGESKPNTLGFKEANERHYEGKYFVSKNHLDIYHLKGKGINGELMLARINENLFHILTSDQQLMVGNGGWSYTLNAEKPVQGSSVLRSFRASENDTARQMVFDGRTPCREFAVDHGLDANPSCFKVKWRLILNRDSGTLEPTTYSTRRIVYDLADNTGKWAIKKTGSDAVIIELNPDEPGRSISLIMLDNNILYFLDKNGQPYTGNADFSFALNRN